MFSGREWRRELATPAKDPSEPTKMQNKKPPPTTTKTSWSKQSAILLVNIVQDVEQKIQKKELLVGKENERTKWDYVATFLHVASPRDAGKTPNNCQYKFWELNRHFKFWRKDDTGKGASDEKERAIYSALKTYYRNCTSVGKKTSVQRRIALCKESKNEPKTDSPPELIGTPLQSVPIRYNDAKCESPDSGRDSVGHLARSNLASQDSAGSPVNHPTDEAAEPLRRSRGRPKGKRKAIDLEKLDLNDVKEKGKNSNRLKQLVDKMARLTSYTKWKQTGVGEDWRCPLTDRLEKRQKRSTRKLIKTENRAKAEETQTQGRDEIEAALREDILCCWNELDKKRPSPEECHQYLLKKYAGEVYW